MPKSSMSVLKASRITKLEAILKPLVLFSFKHQKYALHTTPLKGPSECSLASTYSRAAHFHCSCNPL